MHSKTGPLSVHGDANYEGLQAGLNYAIKGSNRVGETALNIATTTTAGIPTRLTVAKEFIGKDYRILAGTASFGIALKLVGQAEQNKVLYISGPAATDAVTGANKYTFRSGHQSMQDVATATSPRSRRSWAPMQSMRRPTPKTRLGTTFVVAPKEMAACAAGREYHSGSEVRGIWRAATFRDVAFCSGSRLGGGHGLGGRCGFCGERGTGSP
ncbi:hypothetical protein [Arthrobacter psychrochitiniphilus]|uniref:hypothetical protein n=1 Tax=Arthrobacter psychrochitiniphilus TaxID=291045 RepID=UPI003F7BF973